MFSLKIYYTKMVFQTFSLNMDIYDFRVGGIRRAGPRCWQRIILRYR